MMQNRNPYLKEVQNSLPRLLALFDRDRTSESFGIGDRYFWAWGLIDFTNGTFQGAANGLARLWGSGMWPYASENDAFAARLDAIFKGARFATRGDGSCEEAFPNEGSYCVTALVAFDLLNAVDTMKAGGLPEPTQKEWLKIIEPMAEYLKAHDETHAVISNHLATAVAALNRWHLQTGDQAAERKVRVLLERILDHQSSEGWFEEYGGADPGYETLCLHYLADVHLQRPEWKLIEPIARSVGFLWHCAHPDGSFGGTYGSRCTRFYYPSGVLALSPEIPEANALAQFMARSVADQRVVTLAAMDEPNLTPMFNSYCWAAELANKTPHSVKQLPLPCMSRKPTRVNFPKAGLLIDNGLDHYTIVSTLQGGSVSHFKNDGKALHDAGVVVRKPNGRLGSTLMRNASNRIELSEDTLIVHAAIGQMSKRLPNAFYFLGLRGMCSTILRFRPIREWLKRRLARWLITGTKIWPASNRRTIRLGANLGISDEPTLPDGYEVLDDVHNFVPMHMASQGYWQIQDEEFSP